MTDSNASQKTQRKANKKPIRVLEVHGARTYTRAAVPRHRRLVTGFPSLWHGFDPSSGLVGIYGGEMAAGQIFSQ